MSDHCQDGYSGQRPELTKCAAKGHIGRVKFYIPFLHALARPNMKFVKAVWEISEEVQVVDRHRFIGGRPPTGGGRGRDPKITWEEAYETLLKNIC